jgi:two-component system, NtrC family, sensor kinase
MKTISKRRVWVVALSIALLCGFALAGYISVMQQKASVRRDLTRDHETVGEMINLAARRMDARSLKSFVEKLDESRNRLSLTWMDADQSPGPLREGRMHVNIRPTADFAQEITTWHHIQFGNRDIGILRIREISYQSAKLRSGTIFRGTLQAIFTVMGIVAAFLLGWSYVKKPDRKMAAKARRVLAGDFSGRIEASEPGTLSDMAQAMDIMSEKIESVEAEFRAEVASRLVILEQLRHADRLKTVGQLTSGVLHELGTPLTIISGRAKMIEEGDVQGEEASENARIVVEQTARISEMIRNILDFARKGKHTHQVADLNVVIAKAVLLLRPVALKQGVTLEFHKAPGPMMVQAEVSQLQQVLANLILNAIQASRSASVVTVALSRKSARKPGSPESPATDCIVLTVADAGEGIASEHLDAIFDSFYTTKKKGTGTGLGLAIAKQIAIEHAGWITVNSAPGKGSTFRVFLPERSAD